MKEFEKQAWLEELANKFEVPVEQVTIAWAVYQTTVNVIGYTWCQKEFEDVLSKVFKA